MVRKIPTNATKYQCGQKNKSSALLSGMVELSRVHDQTYTSRLRIGWNIEVYFSEPGNCENQKLVGSQAIPATFHYVHRYSRKLSLERVKRGGPSSAF